MYLNEEYGEPADPAEIISKAARRDMGSNTFSAIFPLELNYENEKEVVSW